MAHIVIAAYNEAKVITSVITSLKKERYNKIIIVDDCSKDSTSAVAKKAGAIVLRHPINRGQGAALRTGISYALEQGAQQIVTFDADGQHRATDIQKLLKALEKYDIALGSRFLQKKSKIPFTKRVLLKGAVLLTWILSGIKLTDTHNGLRAMNRNAAEQIEITMDGFEHASEILHEIARKKISYTEVPVYIDYTDYSREKGQSIYNSVRILLRMILRK